MTLPTEETPEARNVVVRTRKQTVLYRLGLLGGSVHDIGMTYAAYAGVIGVIVVFLVCRIFGFSHTALVDSVKIVFLFSSSLIAVIKGEHGYVLHMVKHDFDGAFLALVISAMCLTISIAISLSF